MADMEKAIMSYRNLRDRKKDIADRHKEELAPINNKMRELENWMLAALNEQGANSIKTPSGTVFKKVDVSVKIDDWSSALKMIREEGLWHMLEHRLSKTAVEEYIKAEGVAPPGVAINSTIVVNVRK